MESNEAVKNIENEIKSNPVLLFMKGSKEAPMCGFSAQVIHVLKSYGTDFKTIDVLQDWDVREAIKTYSSWPTIPQLYVHGKFIGGCDITMELHKKGELKAILA